MLRYILLFSTILLSACSSTTSRDYALRHDDWYTWCALNSEDARSGSELAMNNVGTCYLEGLGGFPKDQDQAISWFKESARRGNKTAKMNLELANIPLPDKNFRARPNFEKVANLEKLVAALPE